MPAPGTSLVIPELDRLQELREELSCLELELKKRENLLANLRAEVAAFEVLYLGALGAQYAELDRLRARIAEIGYARHSREAGKDTANEQTGNQSRSFGHGGQTIRSDPQDPIAGSPLDSLKRLYREIVRMIHPDQTADPAEQVERTQLLSEANAAYKRGDDAALRRILEVWKESPYVVTGTDLAAELERLNRRITRTRRCIQETDEEIHRIRTSELYRLKEEIELRRQQSNDPWIDLKAQVDSEIEAAKQELKNATKTDR